MLTKHFFAYRPQRKGSAGIQIEVIVAGDISRQDARRLADEEIAALNEGHALRSSTELRERISKEIA